MSLPQILKVQSSLKAMWAAKSKKLSNNELREVKISKWSRRSAAVTQEDSTLAN